MNLSLRNTSLASGLGSGAIHGALLVLLGVLHPPVPKALPTPKPLAVRMAPAPPPSPQPVVEPPPQPKPPEKPGPPRVRQKNSPQPTPPAPPPPPVAGLSDSMRTDGAKGQGPAVAVGNTAEVGVKPGQPLVAPLADVAPDYPTPLVPVAESAADVPAQCPPLPEVEMGSDALNAGITSGTVVVEVQMGADGKAHSPVLKKGTGFSIDKKIIEIAKKIVCKPAIKNGQPVPLKAKRLVWEIRQ